MLNKARRSVDMMISGKPNCAPVTLLQAKLDDGSHLQGVVAAESADYCISNGVFNLTTNVRSDTGW